MADFATKKDVADLQKQIEELRKWAKAEDDARVAGVNKSMADTQGRGRAGQQGHTGD
jgi:hypothetical protein